jgi:hypothetical protein
MPTSRSSKTNQNPKKNWFLVETEEINLLETLKDLHRLNNYIGKENESYIEFIKTMNEFYMVILAENKKQKIK